MHMTGGAEGTIALQLEAHEADLLRSLLAEMRTLLEADIPQDAIKERLFPRAFDQDDDESSFRSLVGDDLAAAKRQAVADVGTTLGEAGPVEVSLEPAQVETWLRLLTDLRLAIGTRLEVTEEVMGAEVDPSHPDAAALSVLHWLGWIQGSILERLGAPG